MKKLVASLALLSTVAFASAPSPADAAKEHSQAFEKAFNAGDIDAILTGYVDDAVLMGPEIGPEVKGKEAIRKTFAALLAMGVKVEMKSIEAWPVGKDHIFEVSLWEETVPTRDGKTQKLPVRAQELIVKKGGKWLTRVDTFNVLLPPQPATAATQGEK